MFKRFVVVFLEVKQTCIDNSGTHEYYAYDMDKKERVWYVTYGAK